MESIPGYEMKQYSHEGGQGQSRSPTAFARLLRRGTKPGLPASTDRPWSVYGRSILTVGGFRFCLPILGRWSHSSRLERLSKSFVNNRKGPSREKTPLHAEPSGLPWLSLASQEPMPHVTVSHPQLR